MLLKDLTLRKNVVYIYSSGETVRERDKRKGPIHTVHNEVGSARVCIYRHTRGRFYDSQSHALAGVLCLSGISDVRAGQKFGHRRRRLIEWPIFRLTAIYTYTTAFKVLWLHSHVIVTKYCADSVISRRLSKKTSVWFFSCAHATIKFLFQSRRIFN